MNFTLPKNRIAPLIIFGIISIIVSLIIGIYQMNRITQYSYKEKLNTNDSLTQNVVSLIRQEIENTYESLQDSADLVAKTGELNKENIIALLHILGDNKSYVDLAIAGVDGKGYNIAGNAIDVSGNSYFINAENGKVNASDNISYMEDNKSVITITAPIIDQGTYKGILIAKVSTEITNRNSFQNELEQGSQIYIVNSSNKLVLYMQDTDINKFDYYNIILNEQFYYEANNSAPKMGFKEFFVQGKYLKTSYIWDKKSLGINNWSVLIGRVNNISPITKGILKLTNMLWVFITITMFLLFILMIFIQRRSNQKVIKMLYLDPVTGGYNWYRFRIVVSKILSGKQFEKKKFALINFDINRFKTINDSYGYQKGDEVLKEIYRGVKRWAKLDEPFTRYAADQFYILINYQDEEEISERIHNLNDRLHQFHHTTAAKISFGVYQITEQLDSVDRMGEFASKAKNTNKNSVDGIISFFDDVAKGRFIEEERIENTMNEALKNNEFHVFLQPKYMATGEEILGAEALVRWFNSNGNIISPGYFIPVFEKNGFIKKLDFYMLKNVCALLRNWIDKGYTPMPISVNISRLHFINPRLADAISDIVDDYKIPHNLIELELTESAFLQNKQMLIETVILLRSKGFLVSMDDFGAGYSSLNSLKDLPLDVVKLDGELFRMTNEIERGLTVIKNTITMAKDLHMKVVAECIETKEQAEYLCTVGCDIIQGYYFAKPMPTEQFEQRYFVAKS